MEKDWADSCEGGEKTQDKVREKGQIMKSHAMNIWFYPKSNSVLLKGFKPWNDMII